MGMHAAARFVHRGGGGRSLSTDCSDGVARHLVLAEGGVVDDILGAGAPFSREMAHAAGVNDRELRALVRTNYLTRWRSHVFVASADLAAAGEDPPRLHALQIRGLQAGFRTPVVAAAASAAQIYGLEVLDPPPPGLVVMTGDLRISGTHRDGYRLRVARLPSHHVTTCHGARLTTPARTVIDLCAELSFSGGVVVAESAMRRGLVSVDELVEMAAWPAFRRGIRKVRRVIEFLDPLAESPLESASRAVMHELGIRAPRLQVWFVVGGMRIKVDFFWDDVAVIGEADGFTKYAPVPGQDPLTAIRKEKQREQLALEEGLEVVRWGWREVRSPALLQRRLEAAFLRGAERRRGRAG